MAVAGDSHHLPSFPISLRNGQVVVHSWTTNKAREIVEQDIDTAVQRLLAGERFEMYCSGPQVMIIMEQLAEIATQEDTRHA